MRTRVANQRGTIQIWFQVRGSLQRHVSQMDEIGRDNEKSLGDRAIDFVHPAGALSGTYSDLFRTI